MNSIHLPSADPARSEAFYTTHFGFHRKAALGPVVFLESPHGFALSIEEVESTAQFPSGFYVGFAVPSRPEAEALYNALLNAQVPIGHAPLWRSETHLTFAVTDPDGLQIQVSWLAPEASPQ